METRVPHRAPRLAGFVAALAALSLTVPVARASNLFALLDTGELYRSTDGGTTWSIHATLAARDAVGLAASSTVTDLMILTRSGSVYRSSNGGASWSGVGALAASDLAAFTILPDARILALTESGTVYQSSDGGASFTGLAAVTAPNCVSLVRGPVGRLYALTRSGEVYESQSSGSTWSAIGSLPVSNAVSLGRREAELFVLTETGEVNRSTNYGVTWLPVGAITASNMSAMVATNASLIAAARTGEVYRSATGAGWATLGAVNQLRVIALASDEPLATAVRSEEAAPRPIVGIPYPNPAPAGQSVFPIGLDRPATVTLQLFDVHGRLLAIRDRVTLGAGRHALAWAPKRLGAGKYSVRYVVDGRTVGRASWVALR